MLAPNNTDASEIERLQTELDQLRAERSILRAALRPFADAAKASSDEADNRHLHGTNAALNLCMGQLRAAARALSGSATQQ